MDILTWICILIGFVLAFALGFYAGESNGYKTALKKYSESSTRFFDALRMLNSKSD